MLVSVAVHCDADDDGADDDGDDDDEDDVDWDMWSDGAYRLMGCFFCFFCLMNFFSFR